MVEINIFDFFPSPPLSYDSKTDNILSIPSKTGSIPSLFLPLLKSTKSLNSDNIICLYFHSYGEDIGNTEKFLCEVQKTIEIDFLSIEFPGFGTYQTKLSNVKIKDDALAVYDYLVNDLKFLPNKIFTMGWSYGTGPAIYIASHRRVAGVIVIAGYTSLEKFINEFFHEKFANFKFKSEDEDLNNLK